MINNNKKKHSLQRYAFLIDYLLNCLIFKAERDFEVRLAYFLSPVLISVLILKSSVIGGYGVD